jgi:Protein of unknown function (DUF1656)
MTGEFNIGGVYVPTLIISAILAGLVNTALGMILVRVGLYRWVWHRSLFDLAVFVILLTAADGILTGGPALLQPFM